jgi:TPR repeat protein
LEHYRIAAEAGNTLRQLAYGVGLLCKVDLSGNDWIEKSKEQKYSSAWATKAHHYLDGEYVTKDVREGIRHLEKAFEYGFQSCAAELSLIYLKGMHGIEKDHHLSEVWAKKSLVGWRKFVDEMGLLPLRQVFSNVIAFGMAKKFAEFIY